jgi:hypothetical protein
VTYKHPIYAIATVNLVGYGLLTWACYVIHQNSKIEFALTVVVGILGATCGWLIGFLASPANSKEVATFSAYAGIISSFVSGYLVSKLDPVITEFINSKLVFSNQIFTIRIMVFVTCFISATLIMYMYRAYLDPNRKDA